MTAQPTILIHIPYALLSDPNIAPQIRPRRMIEAFQEIGCSTIVISGNARQRRNRMRLLRRRLKHEDLRIDLVYSESSNWPNAMSDGKGSFHPCLDVRFLSILRRDGIPIFVFYRDAYHKSDSFNDVALRKRLARKFLTRLFEWDLMRYNNFVSILYLPSIHMRDQIPQYGGVTRALPPGSSVQFSEERGALGEGDVPLRLLYVGGLGSLYRLHVVCEAVATTPGAHLTICTRRGDWVAESEDYETYLGPRVKVVHESGTELDRLYAESDVAVIAFEPVPYRDFAVPVKLFEYIGRGCPIIASEKTLAGSYVTEHELGWTVPYSLTSISDLLERLLSTEGSRMIERSAESVRRHARTVTWESRAQQVLNDLKSLEADRGR